MSERPFSHLSRSSLQRMRKGQIAAHISDLESRSGSGHLGGMRERSKENLIACALMLQQIETEMEARKNR